MIRTIIAAALGALFGAVAIAPVRRHVQDQFWHPVEACSLGIVVFAAAASLFCLMAMRPPRSESR